MSAALALTDGQLLVASWRRGVLSLPDDRIPCPGMIMREPGPHGRWGVWGPCGTMMLRFVDQWGEEAEALGWSTESRCSACITVPVHSGPIARASSCLFILGRSCSLTELTITVARRETRLVFRGLTNPVESVPVWAFSPNS